MPTHPSLQPYSATDHTKYGRHARKCPGDAYCTNCMPLKVRSAGFLLDAGWHLSCCAYRFSSASYALLFLLCIRMLLESLLCSQLLAPSSAACSDLVRSSLQNLSLCRAGTLAGPCTPPCATSSPPLASSRSLGRQPCWLRYTHGAPSLAPWPHQRREGGLAEMSNMFAGKILRLQGPFQVVSVRARLL